MTAADTARTAFVDQYQAALAEGAGHLTALAARPGARTAPNLHPWVQTQAADLHAAMLAGRVRLCPHIGRSPRTVYAAMWQRWLLVCADCVPTLTPDDVEDATCDRCRRTGLVHPCAVNIGPLLLMFGLCTNCTRRPSP